MKYDVVFLHPPAIHDFRKRVFFPGAIARTVPFSSSQFITIPVGLLSMAEYLERNGYSAKIFNLGEFMIADRNFEVDEFIKRTKANIYAIDLHWCVHSHGAIEIARICKKIRPSSSLVLGGLTATCFHREIVQKFKFIDFIVRGEAEIPFLMLTERLERQKNVENVPNLTYINKNGRISINPTMKPVDTLDNYDFTRLDLVEPKKLLLERITDGSVLRWWCIPIARGCIYDCVCCGASSYAYRKMFNRDAPALRSPQKIIEDINRLREQGIDQVSLFQDPRIGGRKYWENLFSLLSKEKVDVNGLDMELFVPANEEYLKAIAKIGVPIALTISPESGSESVRRAHGRNYSTDDLIKTAKLCQKYSLDIGVFFMLSLGEETIHTIRETWNLWERLYSLNLEGYIKNGEKASIVKPEFGFMLLLDPGSLAFDFPEKYGYRLIFKNFEDYYNGMMMPSWNLWLSYEPRFLDRRTLTDLITKSLEIMVDLEARYRFLCENPSDTAMLSFELFKIKAWHWIGREVEAIMNLSNLEERNKRLMVLKETFEEYLNPERFKVTKSDPFGYNKSLEDLYHQSLGLMNGI
ncbi:MAG: radical SAM protein [Candidatus Hydrothermarchaeota archaeon]